MDVPTLVYTLAAVAIGVLAGFSWGAATMSPPDFRLARALAYAAAIPWFSIGIVFDVTYNGPLLLRLVITGAVGACGLVGLSEGVRWINQREASIVASQTTPVPSRLNLSDEQSQELERINEFLCKKDELQLRETFDFPNVLRFNILSVRRDLAPWVVTTGESDSINKFFEGGKARLDQRYAKVSVVNHSVRVGWIPGKIGAINTSIKYNESRDRLSGFISSSYTPSSVRDALMALDTLVEEDSTKMTESLNQSLSENPNTIIYNDVHGSPFYGSASGRYWQQFSDLKPAADKVSTAIRDFLNSGKPR